MLVVAQVAKAVTKPMRSNPRQKMLMATITDGQNQIDLTFFKAWGHEGEARRRPGRDLRRHRLAVQRHAGS